MKPQKAKYEENALIVVPAPAPGQTRDTRPRDTPGHGHGARPGTPRDTHPGHPGTTCIYVGRGARDLIRDKGPKRGQKYKTYRYRAVSRTHKETTNKKDLKKGRRKHKRQKTQIFLSTFSGPLRPHSGLFSGVSGRRVGEHFSGPGPERAGENTKNHFNLAPAVSQFHGCCRIVPAYCFGTSKMFR